MTNQDGQVVWLAYYEAWGEARVEMCWEHILASQGEICARVNGEVVYTPIELQGIQVSADKLQTIKFQGHEQG